MDLIKIGTYIARENIAQKEEPPRSCYAAERLHFCYGHSIARKDRRYWHRTGLCNSIPEHCPKNKP